MPGTAAPPTTTSARRASSSTSPRISGDRMSPTIVRASGKFSAYVAAASGSISTPPSTRKPACRNPSERPPAPANRSTTVSGARSPAASSTCAWGDTRHLSAWSECIPRSPAPAISYSTNFCSIRVRLAAMDSSFPAIWVCCSWPISRFPWLRAHPSAHRRQVLYAPNDIQRQIAPSLRLCLHNSMERRATDAAAPGWSPWCPLRARSRSRCCRRAAPRSGAPRTGRARCR